MQNGLWVIHHEMPTSITAITVHIKGGSSVEKENEIGSAHFLEHMIFKGTAKYSNENLISGLIEQEGGVTNAFTSHDKICFYIYSKESIELMFDILADGVFNPLFREDDIAVERGAVLQEIADSADNSDDIIAKLFGELIWGAHPLGGDILGSKEQVSALSLESFIGYFQKYFTPSNMALSVAGGIEANKVFDLAFKYFCKNMHKAGRVVLPDVDFSYRPQKRTALLCKDFEQVKYCMGTLPQNWISYDYKNRKEMIAASLLANILGGGMSSRLFRKIRSELGLVYYIRSGLNVYENAGNFWIDFGADASNWVRAAILVFDELENILKNGISEEELKKIKNGWKTHFAKEREDSLRTALSGGKDELNGRVNQTVEEFLKLVVDPITVSDIMNVANVLLPKSNFYLAAMGRVQNCEKDLAAVLD